MEETPSTRPATEGRAWGLELIAVLLLLVDSLLAGMVESGTRTTGPRVLGAVFSPAILVVVVVGLARLFRAARTRRGTALLAIGTLALFGIGQCGALGRRPADAPPPFDPAAYAEKLARDASKGLPRKTESGTELIAVSSEGATAVYTFRLLELSASEVDAATVAPFRDGIVRNACSNPGLRRLIQRQLTIRYVYYGNDKKAVITSFDVTEATCREHAGRRTTG